jgi:hypothetical protein
MPLLSIQVNYFPFRNLEVGSFYTAKTCTIFIFIRGFLRHFTHTWSYTCYLRILIRNRLLFKTSARDGLGHGHRHHVGFQTGDRESRSRPRRRWKRSTGKKEFAKSVQQIGCKHCGYIGVCCCDTQSMTKLLQPSKC